MTITPSVKFSFSVEERTAISILKEMLENDNLENYLEKIKSGFLDDFYEKLLFFEDLDDKDIELN